MPFCVRLATGIFRRFSEKGVNRFLSEKLFNVRSVTPFQAVDPWDLYRLALAWASQGRNKSIGYHLS